MKKTSRTPKLTLSRQTLRAISGGMRQQEDPQPQPQPKPSVAPEFTCEQSMCFACPTEWRC